jgi:hypothetical protein
MQDICAEVVNYRLPNAYFGEALMGVNDPNPSDVLSRLKSLAKIGSEDCHSAADRILCDAIRELAQETGDASMVRYYDELIAVYKSMPKWYD